MRHGCSLNDTLCCIPRADIGFVLIVVINLCFVKDAKIFATRLGLYLYILHPGLGEILGDDIFADVDEYLL